MRNPLPCGPLGRRSLLTAAALPLFAIRQSPARAAEFSYRLATGQGITQLIDARLDQAVRRIYESTSGRLDIQSFPAARLGPEAEQLAQVQNGQIEFLNITGSRLSGIAPASDLVNIGFVFPGYEVVWPAIDGSFGRVIRMQIEQAGVRVISKAADNGFRQITSAMKPIRTPEDLRGFHIRVPDTPIFTSLFTALGAIPVSVGFNDLSRMLETHVIDGQENSFAAIEAAKLYSVQRYVALTNHIWDPFWLLGNPLAMERLPDDIREVVGREFDRASDEQRKDVVRQDAALRGRLSVEGLVLAEVDKPPFRAALAMAGFYSGWQRKFEPDLWKALETVAGPLT